MVYKVSVTLKVLREGVKPVQLLFQPSFIPICMQNMWVRACKQLWTRPLSLSQEQAVMRSSLAVPHLCRAWMLRSCSLLQSCGFDRSLQKNSMGRPSDLWGGRFRVPGSPLRTHSSHCRQAIHTYLMFISCILTPSFLSVLWESWDFLFYFSVGWF